MCVLSYFFFFQAEDGIRDLVRSRGLGDVYKRQGSGCPFWQGMSRNKKTRSEESGKMGEQWDSNPRPVSYTHLTLPTSDLV